MRKRGVYGKVKNEKYANRALITSHVCDMVNLLRMGRLPERGIL